MRTRTVIFLIVLAAAVVPIWYAFAQGYRTTTSYTCARCRVVKHTGTFFGYESVRIEETDYSRWFAQRQPSHTHQWGWCGTVLTYYPMGLARGCGRRHPVWQIPPEIQKVYVATASVDQVEQFYAAMELPDGFMRASDILLPSTDTKVVSTNIFE